MKVEISIHDSLQKCITDAKMCNRVIDINSGSCLKNLPEEIDISIERIGFYVVNGKVEAENYMLQEGDKVTIYPCIAGG